MVKHAKDRILKDTRTSWCLTDRLKKDSFDPIQYSRWKGEQVRNRRQIEDLQVDKSDKLKNIGDLAYRGTQLSPNASIGNDSIDLVKNNDISTKGGFKKGSGNSFIIPYLTEKIKLKGIFETPKTEKTEQTLAIIRANVKCEGCGWTTEIDDLTKAKEFRRGEVHCPNCNATRFKIKNPFPYTIQYPYFALEEEFRGELINIFYDNVDRIDIMDSRKDKCIEPIMDGEFPLYPQTGDIHYFEKGKFKSIELKFTTLNPQKDSKVGGLCYRVLRSVPIKLNQLELIKNGIMKLVILAEFVEDVVGLGVSSVAVTRERAVQDIQIIREALGRDELTYAYLLIESSNWEDYEFYFDNLKVGEKRDEWGNVIERRKQTRFPTLWRDYTEEENRYRAKRSEICLEITKRLFKLE